MDGARQWRDTHGWGKAVEGYTLVGARQWRDSCLPAVDATATPPRMIARNMTNL